MNLTGKQKRHLRSLGNRLEAKLIIGHSGITEKTVANLDLELKTSELVKVKLTPACSTERKEAAAMLSEACGAAVAQIFGRTFLLYRENPDNKQIKLP